MLSVSTLLVMRVGWKHSGATNWERLSQIKKSMLKLVLHIVRILLSNKWETSGPYIKTHANLSLQLHQLVRTEFGWAAGSTASQTCGLWSCLAADSWSATQRRRSWDLATKQEQNADRNFAISKHRSRRLSDGHTAKMVLSFSAARYASWPTWSTLQTQTQVLIF